MPRQTQGSLRDSVSCCHPAWHLLFLNVLILLMLRDLGVFESRPEILHSSNQIRNGASLTAQNLPDIPDRDETVVLNLCKPN